MSDHPIADERAVLRRKRESLDRLARGIREVLQ